MSILLPPFRSNGFTLLGHACQCKTLSINISIFFLKLQKLIFQNTYCEDSNRIPINGPYLFIWDHLKVIYYNWRLYTTDKHLVFTDRQKSYLRENWSKTCKRWKKTRSQMHDRRCKLSTNLYFRFPQRLNHEAIILREEKDTTTFPRRWQFPQGIISTDGHHVVSSIYFEHLSQISETISMWAF